MLEPLEFFSNINPWILVIFLIWSLPWKGVALWKAARMQEKIWFVVLLVTNTAALLDILYIFIFSKKNEHPLN